MPFITTIETTTNIPISQQLATHNIFMALLVGICFMAFLSFCLFHLRKLFYDKNNCQQQQSSHQQQNNELFDTKILSDSIFDVDNLLPTYNNIMLITPKNSPQKGRFERGTTPKINIEIGKIFPINKQLKENYHVNIPKISAIQRCNSNRWRGSSTKISIGNSCAFSLL